MDVMLVIFVVSFLILALGAVYKKVEEIFLTEPLLAMVAGIILGPQVLEVIQSDVPEKFKILEKICEFTIAMALMATALRLPKNFYKNNFQSQTLVVILGMLLMWCFSSAIIYFLFPELKIAECLLIGAIITPTDPVLSSTIVSGDKAEKYLPASIRNTISFESGINDGLAYPLVFFSIFLINSSGFPLEKWLTQTLLYETLLCAGIAFIAGHIAGWVMHKAHKKNVMTVKAVLPYSIGLSLLLLSGFDLLKMNGILAVFVGGLAFSRAISNNEDIEEVVVQESIERITLIPVFFIFGLFLPWEDWFSLGWTALALVVLVLIFRRIPGILLLKPVLPLFKRKTADILMLGWFGPIGVAALYYAILSEDKAYVKEAWIVASLVVFASTIVHGITSLPLGKIYHNKRKGKKS